MSADLNPYVPLSVVIFPEGGGAGGRGEGGKREFPNIGNFLLHVFIDLSIF